MQLSASRPAISSPTSAPAALLRARCCAARDGGRRVRAALCGHMPPCHVVWCSLVYTGAARVPPRPYARAARRAPRAASKLRAVARRRRKSAHAASCAQRAHAAPPHFVARLGLPAATQRCLSASSAAASVKLLRGATAAHSVRQRRPHGGHAAQPTHVRQSLIFCAGSLHAHACAARATQHAEAANPRRRGRRRRAPRTACGRSRTPRTPSAPRCTASPPGSSSGE